ncbi:hypothetical protein B0F90DRAFT_1731021 [Multifurca ochricompacta]|uniref:Uncharacterized protein n=1 Tax=Multifurca ochricompacta TaxID=376703 RepID=A0AAD4QMM7_9AGAM|nr:hypothetical protein B0F90DRAFT_1731021 [Multifurca ochricompacta]
MATAFGPSFFFFLSFFLSFDRRRCDGDGDISLRRGEEVWSLFIIICLILFYFILFFPSLPLPL